MSLDLVVETKTRREAPARVLGRVNYIVPATERPYAAYSYEPGAGSATNAHFTAHEVTIHNARRRETALSLDVHGVELVRHRSVLREFDDEDDIVEFGHCEAANIVKAATGAHAVLVFDHTVRRRTPDAPRQPSIRVHNDYTAKSARQRVRDLLGEEAEALLQKRVAFINVWRPINHPAVDQPLALCDARSVAANDLIEQDVIYPDRSGEIYAVAHNSSHRWFYYPSMQLDEAVLIKCYDSRAGIARFTPHTSFTDPSAPADAPPRESIEYRAMAFY